MPKSDNGIGREKRILWLRVSSALFRVKISCMKAGKLHNLSNNDHATKKIAVIIKVSYISYYLTRTCFIQ